MNTFIFGLHRTPHRRSICEQSLRTQGFQVSYFLGADNRDYPGLKALVDAAVADGFPAFGAFLKTSTDRWHNISMIGQSWGYCQFLRSLPAALPPVLLIQDRRQLLIDVLTVTALVDRLLHIDPDFITLSLSGDATLDGLPTLVEGIHLDANDWAQVIQPKFADIYLSKFLDYLASIVDDETSFNHHTHGLEAFLKYGGMQRTYSVDMHCVRVHPVLKGQSVINEVRRMGTSDGTIVDAPKGVDEFWVI